MTPEPTVVSFDLKPWLRAGRFVLRSLRRRWFVASALLLVFTGVAVAAAILLPRVYTGEIRILAKKNYTMPALAAPRRTVPPSSEVPAQSASELILQQEALIRVVRGTGLAERWNAHAPMLTKVKASLRERIKGPLSAQEMEDALVALLRERLQVRLVQNEVITIRLRWWNQDDVVVILEEVLQSFLSARMRIDVETIEETEAILTRAAEAQRQTVEQRLEDFRVSRAHAVGGSTERLATSRHTEEEVVAIRDALDARQRHRLALERQRDLRIGDLQLQIAEQSATLGQRHPDHIAARDALSRMMEDDGGVARALAQEEALGRSLEALRASSRERPETEVAGDFVDAGINPDETSAVIHARSLLRMDMDHYQDMVTRLKNVRVELETARAAFPFRYMVTRPPTRPQKPDSPNVLMVVVGGLIAGFVAAVMVAVALEARTRLAAILQEQLA